MEEETDIAKLKTKITTCKNLLLDIEELLEDIIYREENYKASLEVFSRDWDSEEDQHWDNF